MAAKLSIDTGTVRLEAVLRRPRDTPVGAVVICHPHPAFGGTMDNRVVYRAAKAAEDARFAALRFNFRGVGASTGSYDEGRGEQEDVAAAIDWVESRYPGLPLSLIGFSFGAWVGLRVGCRDSRIRSLVGLGLPVGSYDFRFLTDNMKPTLFICGTNDSFCPRERMDELVAEMPLSSGVIWIEGADHFFDGKIDELQARITAFLRDRIRTAD